MGVEEVIVGEKPQSLMASLQLLTSPRMTAGLVGNPSPSLYQDRDIFVLVFVSFKCLRFCREIK